MSLAILQNCVLLGKICRFGNVADATGASFGGGVMQDRWQSDEPSPADRAIEHVRTRADRERPASRAILHDIARRSGLPPRLLDDAITSLERHAQIVIHFHPDRLSADGSTVAEGLLRDGRYRNQFETGISNGIIACPNTERDRWEANLFGGAFRDASAMQRPKYGALDFLGYADGAVPFFGSCYLVLRAEVARRSTFTMGDSCEAGEVGVPGAMDSLMAGLLTFVAAGGSFSDDRLSVAALLSRLAQRPMRRPRDPATQPLGRILAYYIEAQLHGSVDLATDVEMLVADPSFQATPTGETLAVLCARNGIALRWHAGFTLAATRVPDNFRGPLEDGFRAALMPALAQRIAVDGCLTAEILGRAAAGLHRHGANWRECAVDDALKDISHLWYLLVHFGTPAIPLAGAAEARRCLRSATRSR